MSYDYLWLLVIPIVLNLYLFFTDVEFMYFLKDVIQISWIKVYFAGFYYIALKDKK